MTSTWIHRWHDWIASEPEPNMPGVWRRRDGGFRIRGRCVDPRTGTLREIRRALPDCKRAREAAAVLQAELDRIRLGTADAAGEMPRFASWAVTVLERKLAAGTIASASGRKTWDWALRVHLIPAFGELYIDKLTGEDVERWKERELLVARAAAKDAKRNRKLAGDRYRPQTVNTLLAILRQVTGAASEAFNIADACRSIDGVSKRLHRTYTYEEPNALKCEDVPRFLDEMRVRFPEHYAFVFLGFTTGLRPSSLRPLRARGPQADVKWDEGKLLVRRSHTHASEVMDATKTGRDQLIALDKRQVDVLRWHLDRLAKENERRAARSPENAAVMASSDLLFPSDPNGRTRGGGYRSASCMDKAFAQLSELLQLGYRVTPRGMRRTYQDLCRAANVADIVTRSISGHATPEMQRHYSTVSADEQRGGLNAVINEIELARARRGARAAS